MPRCPVDARELRRSLPPSLREIAKREARCQRAPAWGRPEWTASCLSLAWNGLLADTTMAQLRKVLRVAREEVAFDPRRLGVLLLSSLLPQNSFNRTRTQLLRALGVQIGAASTIAGPLRVTGSGSLREALSIGPGCHVTGPLHIDLTAPVRIGARVYVGYDVMLITADHELGDSGQRCGPRVYRAIDVDDGVWLSSRVVVLPGVRIGRGSVVAAGAVVTRDVPPNVLVGGVPARVLRDLEDGEASQTRRDRLALTTWSPASARA
jgi:maltose O-acetyltransferase